MWNMAFSDYFIRQAIENILAEKPYEPISYTMIAARLENSVSKTTVKRSVKRLMDARKLKRYGGGNKVGYRYELVS
jgi:DNA-binding Lrp family transcriptional regulator